MKWVSSLVFAAICVGVSTGVTNMELNDEESEFLSKLHSDFLYKDWKQSLEGAGGLKAKRHIETQQDSLMKQHILSKCKKKIKNLEEETASISPKVFNRKKRYSTQPMSRFKRMIPVMETQDEITLHPIDVIIKKLNVEDEREEIEHELSKRDITKNGLSGQYVMKFPNEQILFNSEEDEGEIDSHNYGQRVLYCYRNNGGIVLCKIIQRANYKEKKNAFKRYKRFVFPQEDDDYYGSLERSIRKSSVQKLSYNIPDYQQPRVIERNIFKRNILPQNKYITSNNYYLRRRKPSIETNRRKRIYLT